MINHCWLLTLLPEWSKSYFFSLSYLYTHIFTCIPTFSSISFIVPGLMLMFLFYFELIFFFGKVRDKKSISWPVFPASFAEIFSLVCIFGIFVKIRTSVVFISASAILFQGPCICVYASILLLLLWLCSISWNQVWWYF